MKKSLPLLFLLISTITFSQSWSDWSSWNSDNCFNNLEYRYKTKYSTTTEKYAAKIEYKNSYNEKISFRHTMTGGNYTSDGRLHINAGATKSYTHPIAFTDNNIIIKIDRFIFGYGAGAGNYANCGDSSSKNKTENTSSKNNQATSSNNTEGENEESEVDQRETADQMIARLKREGKEIEQERKQNQKNSRYEEEQAKIKETRDRQQRNEENMKNLGTELGTTISQLNIREADYFKNSLLLSYSFNKFNEINIGLTHTSYWGAFFWQMDIYGFIASFKGWELEKESQNSLINDLQNDDIYWQNYDGSTNRIYRQKDITSLGGGINTGVGLRFPVLKENAIRINALLIGKAGTKSIVNYGYKFGLEYELEKMAFGIHYNITKYIDYSFLESTENDIVLPKDIIFPGVVDDNTLFMEQTNSNNEVNYYVPRHTSFTEPNKLNLSYIQFVAIFRF